MKMQKFSLSLMLGLLLVGCDSRIDAVNEQMANIRNQPPLPIEPAPVFPPVPTFDYAAHQLKSCPRHCRGYCSFMGIFL